MISYLGNCRANSANVGVNKFFKRQFIMDIQEATSTLFNLASKYRDEKAIEAVKLVEEKFTSTNKQSTPLCDKCQRNADNSCKVDVKCVYFIPIE